MTETKLNVCPIGDREELYLRNRAKSIGALNEYDRELMLDAAHAICELQDMVNRTPTELPNDPLAPGELREMDGEPAWCLEYEHYGIVSVADCGCWAGIPFLVGQWKQVKFDYDIKRRGLTLYRRKPDKAQGGEG